ncbi:hypothetical protein K8R43_03145 [archaeon]|nr:hypothetical protein [archaeon]
MLDVLENEEELVNKILEKSEISREKLEEKIEKKKEEYGGLLTTGGAAYSIAKDMGIDLELKEDEMPLTPIKEIDTDLGRTSVKGVVTHVFPIREWESKSRKGTVASINLKDTTGETRISFWNDDCEKLEDMQIGAHLEILNASTKKRGEFIELSFGKTSQIIFKQNSDLPEYKEQIVKINELKEGMKDVNCYARITRIFPAKTFQRSDGSEGSIASIVINDGIETRLALWDQQSKWADKLSTGDIIKIEGAYAKENNGKIELNMGWKGRMLKNPKDAPILPEAEKSERKNIDELETNNNYEIRAVIVKAYPPNLFSSNGKDALVFNSELDDGTGVIRGVFFRNAAEKILGVNAEQLKSDGYDTNKILGIEKVFEGQTKHNQRFDRNEFIINRVKDVDLKQEIEMLKGV